MGWVQNLRFSYIFMEPAKTHGIYTVLTSSASETVVFAAFCNTTLYTATLIVLLLQKQQQLLLLLPLLRTTTYYYVLLRTTYTYYYVLRTTYYVLRTTYYYVLRTTYMYYVYVLRICTTYMYYVYVLRIRIRTTYYYVLLRTTTYYYVLLRTTTYYYVLLRTINQYKQIVIIHKSIETYSYTYTWLQMVRPPQPTHRGGGGNIMCTCSIFVCRHKNNDMSTLLGHAHTYIPTDRQTHRHTYINQYKQIVIIHKSIETYSYTYTWLQMVRPPQPTHRGGAGTLCVHVVSLCADTKTMTCRPCLDTYIHTYKQTINQYKQIVIIHKSIETYSYTYTWLQMVRPPQPTHRGGAGTLCVHVVSLCADTKTMTCRPCWDTHILTYQQTDRHTGIHT